MNKATCQTIQSELDLLMLGELISPEVSAHLNECAACSDFQAKQTRLREIVGSLGTVSAPADFDFRLRARLANERPASGLSFGTSWLSGPRAVAAGSAIAVVLAVVAFVTYNSRPTQQVSEAPRSAETVAVTPPQPNSEKSVDNETGVTANHSTEQKNVGTSSVTAVKNNRNQRVIKRQLATTEFSSTGAESIKPAANAEATDAIFSIEASQQPYRVSLYDGRGKARTISVPPVSFGSQRAIPTSNQFAPKGIW